VRVNVLLDLFPARLTIDGKTTKAVRVFVADDRVRVYADKRSGVELIHDEEISGFEQSPRPRSQPHMITLESGEQWTCMKGGGCGCGSRLKRFDPTQAVA
jgi:hypothetical protein